MTCVNANVNMVMLNNHQNRKISTSTFGKEKKQCAQCLMLVSRENGKNCCRGQNESTGMSMCANWCCNFCQITTGQKCVQCKQRICLTCVTNPRVLAGITYKGIGIICEHCFGNNVKIYKKSK